MSACVTTEQAQEPFPHRSMDGQVPAWAGSSPRPKLIRVRARYGTAIGYPGVRWRMCLILNTETGESKTLQAEGSRVPSDRSISGMDSERRNAPASARLASNEAPNSQLSTDGTSADVPDVLLAVFSTVLPDEAHELISRQFQDVSPGSSIYVSVPVTTGPALLHELEREGPGGPVSHSILNRVRERNARSAARLVSKVKRAFPGELIIDPSSLYVPQWEQRDYHRYWIEVLQTFAKQAVFADGWPLSTGCSIEFCVCAIRGIPCLDARLKELSIQRGAELLVDASAELRRLSLPSDVARAAPALLELIAAKGADPQ